MRTLVYSALALTLVSVPGLATENEWSSLDKEMENLSASLSAQNAPGPKASGYVRISYRHSGDGEALDINGSAGNPAIDESGFKLENVRIEVSGDAGSDYSYKVSFDLKGGSAELKDAYVKWKIAEDFSGTMGNFKQPFLHSGLVSKRSLLFIDRTALGRFFSERNLGLMVGGSFDTVDWAIAGQNDNDGKEDEHLFTARIAAHLMGSGAGKVEGAYGASEETALSVGLAVADKGTLVDGQHFAVDASMTSGPFSVAAELVDFDKGDTAGNWAVGGKDDIWYGSDNAFTSWDPADTTPWSLTFSYMFTAMYEVGVRYEDADNVDDQTALSIVVNRYVQGHDIKWQVQYMTADGDQTFTDLDEISIGLTVAW